jgi:hypothetical protein
MKILLQFDCTISNFSSALTYGLAFQVTDSLALTFIRMSQWPRIYFLTHLSDQLEDVSLSMQLHMGFNTKVLHISHEVPIAVWNLSWTLDLSWIQSQFPGLPANMT